MKQRLLFAIAIAGAFLAVGCGTTIEPGRVGIIINRYGKNRGVQDYTVTSGRVWYNTWSTDVVEYPTSVQTVQWTANKAEGNPQDESITFTTKESVQVNADVSLSYQLDVNKVPAFYVKFRSDDLNTFTYGFLHNIARDAMMEIGGHYTVENIMGDNEQFLHEVRQRIQSQVADIGVEIQQFGFIGAPRPPEGVIQAINEAQRAKYLAQQKQNELVQVQADAAKRVAQSEGEAKSNAVLANSITDKLLSWQQIQLQYTQLAVQDRWIARWNGQMPQVTGGNGQNGMGILLQQPAPKQ